MQRTEQRYPYFRIENNGRPQGIAHNIHDIAEPSRHMVGAIHCGRPFSPSPLSFSSVYFRSIFMLCILASFLFLPLSVSAHTLANNGRITGQLLDGTKKNAPLAGQQVTLQEAQGANSRDLSTVTSDTHGNYSFANLSTDKTISYAVYKQYQGAQYVSDVVTFANNPTQQVNLTVYDATTSTAKIAILQNTILMHQPDAQKGTISVSEILSFRNLDSHTYVGSFDTSKGKPNTLRFSLPGNARNLTLGTGFDGYHTAQVDLGFATDAALPPGITQFSFSYQIAYSAATYDFRYVNVYPTVDLSLLIPPSLQVDPGFLTNAGITNSGNDSYRLYKAEALLANDEVHASLAGLPTQNSSTSAGTILNTNIIWLIVGVLILLAIIAIIGYLTNLRGRKRAATTRNRGKQATSATNVRTKQSAKVHKEVVSATPKDREDALLQELLSLDKAYESGKLSKAAYNERRAKAKARLRSIMSEQEAVRR